MATGDSGTSGTLHFTSDVGEDALFTSPLVCSDRAKIREEHYQGKPYRYCLLYMIVNRVVVVQCRRSQRQLRAHATIFIACSLSASRFILSRAIHGRPFLRPPWVPGIFI